MDKSRLDASNKDTHIYPINPPPNLLLFKSFIVKAIFPNCFVLLLSTNNIILHTSPNYFLPVLIHNHHQKIYLSIPPYIPCRPPTSGHGTYSYHLSPHIQITPNETPYHHKNWTPPPPWGLGLLLQSPVSPQYLLIYPQQNPNNKTYKVHWFSNMQSLSKSVSPPIVNNSTCPIWGGVNYTLLYLLEKLLFQTYILQQGITNISIMNVFKLE